MSDTVTTSTLPPPADGGPWSPAMQLIRARRDLAEIAAAMHARRREPGEILEALARQAELWREAGVVLPSDAALRALRQLPGLASYDPLAHWQARWAGVDLEGHAVVTDGDHERRETGSAGGRLVSASAQIPHGYCLSGARCADCPGYPPADFPSVTPRQVRERRRGERLARLIRQHADVVRPVLLDLLAEDMGALISEIIDSKRRKP